MHVNQPPRRDMSGMRIGRPVDSTRLARMPNIAAAANPIRSIEEQHQLIGDLARLMLGCMLYRAAGDERSRHAVDAAEVARLLGGIEVPAAARAEADALWATAVHGLAILRARLDATSPATTAPLRVLVDVFELSVVELAIVTILAALEIHLELERAFAMAWNDLTRKRPDIGFLAMLCGGPNARGREDVIAALEPGAPLRRHQLVVLTGGSDAPLVLQTARLSDRIVAHLRGHRSLEESISAVVSVVEQPPALAELIVPPAIVERLSRALASPVPARVLLVGPDGVGKSTLAAAVAAQLGRSALRVQLGALGVVDDGGIDRLQACAREAALRGAILCIELEEHVHDDRMHVLRTRSVSAIASMPVPVVITAVDRPHWLIAALDEVSELEVPPPTYQERIRLWERALAAVTPERELLEVIAGRYGFGGATIERSARRAVASAHLRDPSAPNLTLDDLSVACRMMLSNRLGAVAQRIPAAFRWEDLVLPRDTMAQLREVVAFARQRPFLLDTWGFASKLPYGRGVSAILAGPPGTGKTMVAQILARELGYDLYRIDLSQIVNKYIGETEKNLARIFHEAEDSYAILFFDEADSLFAKRTEVKSSNDRYANLEVNYLLQRMEVYDGVTLLATNIEQGLDEAFKRRVRFNIQFELPDVDERKALWRSMIPAQTPLADDIDWDRLADRFEMAGGYIKKAVLRAALIAAEARPPRPICHADLLQAALFEYREMGRVTAG